MKKEIKKLISAILTILMVFSATTLTAFAATKTYAEAELEALNKFLSYGENSNILDWSLEDNVSTDEVYWELEEDGEYHIVEINLSNLSVSGKIDLIDCEYLEDVYFSNTNIEEVILPESIEILGRTAFSNCSSLIYVELNSEELTIGKNTFSGCTNLRTVLNTDSITSIGTNAFDNCKKVTFYGSDKSSVAAEYATSKRISFSTNYTVTAICYVGIMTNSNVDTVDLTNNGIPYRTGYITTNYGTFYADEDGMIEFYIDLGCNQDVTIDGATALTREAVFDVLYNNYNVSTENNAIGIVVCNYIKDSTINAKDYYALIRYTIGSDEGEDYCYDVDGDGVISNFDKAYYQEFISTSSNPALTLYTSWR